MERISEEILFVKASEDLDSTTQQIYVSYRLPKTSFVTNTLTEYNTYAKRVYNDTDRNALISGHIPLERTYIFNNASTISYQDNDVPTPDTRTPKFRNFEFVQIKGRKKCYLNCMDGTLDEHTESHSFLIFSEVQCPTEGGFFCRTHNPAHPNTQNSNANYSVDGLVLLSDYNIVADDDVTTEKSIINLRKLDTFVDVDSTKMSFVSDSVLQHFAYDATAPEAESVYWKEDQIVRYLNENFFYGKIAKLASEDPVVDADGISKAKCLVLDSNADDASLLTDFLMGEYEFENEIVNNNNAVLDCNKVYSW
jgi:hypothetical protein